jgi:hypothetical protein
MDKISKYQFNPQNRTTAYYAFERWLEKCGGKEAVNAYIAIEMAGIFQRNFENCPESKMTRKYKLGITWVKKELSKATAWLKAEGCLE